MSEQQQRQDEYASELGPRFYQQLVTIREFERQVAELYMQTLIPGIAHVSIGQEAVAVGVCGGAGAATTTSPARHRGHGPLAWPRAPARSACSRELLGKEDGFCLGKGGSMHIADPETGNLAANAIVGGSLAIAAGAALGAKRRGEGQVAVCFFGDGALNAGAAAGIDEHGLDLEAAGALRLREQPVRRVHAHRGKSRPATWSVAARPSTSPRSTWTAWT